MNMPDLSDNVCTGRARGCLASGGVIGKVVLYMAGLRGCSVLHRHYIESVIPLSLWLYLVIRIGLFGRAITAAQLSSLC